MSQKKFGKRTVIGAVVAMLGVPVLIGSSQVMAQGASAQSLENQIRLLEDQLQSIRGELEQVKSDTERNEQEIRRSEAQVVSTHGHEANKHEHILFFRGGFARNDHFRNGISIQSEVVPVNGGQADKGAWYVGAGFDFSLTDDVWGLLPGTSVFAELMFVYKEFSNSVQGNALANNPTVVAPVSGGINPRKVTVSQFTLTAAPKIKFMEGSKFRPWIIPAGLALHVVSPPTDSITVLQPGVMFGVGADYNFWKTMYIGADARYELAGGKLDGVDVSGFSVGGYLGIGF